MPPRARPHRWRFRFLAGFACILILIVVGLMGLRHYFPLEYRDTILEWSATYDLDPACVASIVRFESRFRPDAVSRAGAIGLMQIMPATGAWIAEQQTPSLTVPVDLQSPTTNLRLGTWYLRYLLDRFTDRDVALMAYNAGPSRTETWLATGEDPFPETASYVERVQRCIPLYRVLLRMPWLYSVIPDPLED